MAASPGRGPDPPGSSPARVVAALTLAYAGLYLCRSDLPLAAPLLLEELGPQGLDKKALGLIASFGVLAFALGKLAGGLLSDRLGGRGVLLAAMSLSSLATVAIAWIGTRQALELLWPVNLLAQSLAWPAVAKLIARQVPAHQHGRAFAVAALGYFFGDSLVRTALALALKAGLPWRGLFFLAAAGLGAWTLATAAALAARAPPPDRPESPAAAEPASQARAALAHILRAPAFWLVCAVSACLTLVRESLGTWTPTYLVEVLAFRPGPAGAWSGALPLCGGFGLLLVGWIADRRGGARAGAAIGCFLLGGAAVLALVSAAEAEEVALTLLALAGFAILGPYGLVTGAVAHRLGGERAGATAVGLVDGAGYLAGTLSGRWIGGLAQDAGWSRAWWTLAALTFAAAILSFAQVRSGR